MRERKKNWKEDVFGFGQSLVLSRLKHMISQKQKEGKSCRCFRLLSKTFSLSSRKQRDDDDESAGRNVPVLLPLPSCLSYAEKRKEKDRIKLEKFKNVRLLLVGKPQQQTLFDTTRSSRVCISRSLSKRSRAMHRQRYVRRTMFNKFIPMVTSRSHR